MSIKNLVEMIKHNGLLASMAHLEKLYQVAIENEQKLAELESNLAALAAENALLKKSEPAPFSKLMMEALDVYQEGADEVPELAMLSAYKKLREGLKTPATDAFLAEVRAQGVERLANAWYAIANETDPGISISDSSRLKYRQRADDAADFANEIRQEAAQ
ncbi:hypothetical protein [Enterobacter hormaechei]|uniref:hypothetical protein n=1 Tax=Enterobacter hormaechei TaxID=158836 RepID=UPI0032B0CDFE